MMSGDGLLVRLRPPGGRLTAAQGAAVADVARRFGNGRMDLSSRAGLQIRGVTEDTHPPLIEALRDAGLVVDASPVLAAPFAPDPMEATLTTALADLSLPPKFGVVLDRGAVRVMADTPADIRLEGDLVRADGQPLGRRGGAETVRALAEWFLTTGAKRMRDVTPPPHLAGDIAPPPATVPALGAHPHGTLVGLPFGELTPDTLVALGEVVLTPWRALFLPCRTAPDRPDLILSDADPLRRVVACPGAPACAQGHAPTRPLARALAARVQGTLHISGCAKGCARPRDPATTLVALPDGFGLIPFGRASDPPQRRGLPPDACITLLGGTNAAQL
nr:cobalamin biosynthesis protein CobG [Falsirhodobacter halotolerans]